MQHRCQTTDEHVPHTVAVETGKDRFRLECGHGSLFVSNERTGGPKREIETQERRVILEPLLRCPGESFDDQAPVVRVLVLLLLERVAQHVGICQGMIHGGPASL